MTEIEDMAIRITRLVREQLTWDDAQLAIQRAQELLLVERIDQPEPHGGRDG